MRRESEWMIMGFSLVLFAFTTQAHHRPSNDGPLVINLRSSDSVILRIDQAPMVMSSLPAADERSLFGIEVEPPILAALPETLTGSEPVLREAPRKRFAALTAGRRKTARGARALPDVPVAQIAEARAASEKADLAVMELAAPPRGSRAAVAPADSVAATSSSLGFSLSERAAVKVGPLSSMVPSYSADTAHGDFQERWRLNDERDASHDAGAAVGMTFKLN